MSHDRLYFVPTAASERDGHHEERFDRSTETTPKGRFSETLDIESLRNTTAPLSSSVRVSECTPILRLLQAVGVPPRATSLSKMTSMCYHLMTTQTLKTVQLILTVMIVNLLLVGALLQLTIAVSTSPLQIILR